MTKKIGRTITMYTVECAVYNTESETVETVIIEAPDTTDKTLSEYVGMATHGKSEYLKILKRLGTEDFLYVMPMFEFIAMAKRKEIEKKVEE